MLLLLLLLLLLLIYFLQYCRRECRCHNFVVISIITFNVFVTVFCIFHSNFRFTVNIVSVVIITCYRLFAIVVIEVVVLIFDVKFQFNNTLQYNTIQYNTIQYNTIQYILYGQQCFTGK